ncbi:MAG: hypothetical protein MUF83_19475 [Acidimicrobiales bacterium]|jgi:hypothetical protein|nr:hypothetical protein [Acidimicrobiales bacterium]
MTDDGPRPDPAESPLVRAVMNLAAFHRDHEKYYASAPREQAVGIQRHARTLQALADHWSTAEPSTRQPFSPFEGADDLNATAAIQLDGVLFLEGGEEPAELRRLERDLRAMAEDQLSTSDWLATAMTASWEMAASFLPFDELADLLGERHRIIANDWQAASLGQLAGRVLLRALEILDTVELTPTGLRRPGALAVAANRLWSAAELLDHAADLFSDSAGLVHDNERRWRVFRARVEQLLADHGA